MNATAADLFGKDPGLEATLAASGVQASGQAVDQLNARANGRLSDLAIGADARGRDLALITKLNLQMAGDETKIGLAELDLTIGLSGHRRPGQLEPALLRRDHAH